MRVPNGQKCRVLLFPGIGCTTPVVRWFLSQLRAVGDASVIPLPGYSLPGDKFTDFTPEALAASALSALDITDADSAPLLLIGHSAGCQVAGEFAAQVAPSQVRLVLIGPTIDPRARGWLRLAVRWARTAVREPMSLAPVLARSYRTVGLRNMARAIDAAREHDLEATLSRANCAVLVLRGRADAIAPQKWVARLADQQQIEERNIEGAHMIVMTAPRQITTHIADWLGYLKWQPPRQLPTVDQQLQRD